MLKKYIIIITLLNLAGVQVTASVQRPKVGSYPFISGKRVEFAEKEQKRLLRDQFLILLAQIDYLGYSDIRLDYPRDGIEEYVFNLSIDELKKEIENIQDKLIVKYNQNPPKPVVVSDDLPLELAESLSRLNDNLVQDYYLPQLAVMAKVKTGLVLDNNWFYAKISLADKAYLKWLRYNMSQEMDAMNAEIKDILDVPGFDKNEWKQQKETLKRSIAKERLTFQNPIADDEMAVLEYKVIRDKKELEFLQRLKNISKDILEKQYKSLQEK